MNEGIPGELHFTFVDGQLCPTLSPLQAKEIIELRIEVDWQQLMVWVADGDLTDIPCSIIR